jgi:chemotaxis protein MotB
MGKKKHEHHGGAWKVAYADFVTAMMALFMVLWISAQDQEILIATSQYFQNPFNSPMNNSAGVLTAGAGEGNAQGAAPDENSESSLNEVTLLNKLARDFYRMLAIEETQTNTPVDVTVTNDGLRVTVYDRADRPIFKESTADFTEWGTYVVENIAWVLAQRPFAVRIDGHVAAGFESPEKNYGGWELSADRANAVRRALQHFAVPADKFERVTGFSDTVTLPGKSPADQSNDRVEMSLVLVPALKSSGS